MLIQLNNLPVNITEEIIDDMCQHSHLIKYIHIVNEADHGRSYAWVNIDCSRVALNAICNIFNTKYINGRHVMAYPTLYSN